MTEWKKICCAVDFGDPSRAAMEHAAELASRFAADLLLVHVVPPPPEAAADVVLPAADATAGAKAMLDRWREAAERRSGRPAQSSVLLGDPADRIVRFAREASCDLLVVGTHGRTGIPRLIVGSVAERVVRLSGCPVLVVHEDERREKEELAEEIAQYR